MNQKYAQHYAVLGLKPGDGWTKLRDAYRRQIRKWHPDRYSGDATQRRVAEETTKAINAAYHELAIYYRQHGDLPPPLPDKQLQQTQTSSPPPSTGTAGNTGRSHPGIWSTASTRPAPRRSHGAAWLALFGAVSIYVVLQLFQGDVTGYGPTNVATVPANEETNPQSPPDADTGHGSRRYFTIGSTLGEVYAIQGVPSKTENDVWYYGNARVYFRNGRVTGWDDDPSSPLRAHGYFSTAQRDLSDFGLGSTKEDVRRAQGAPIVETENVWDYGVSKVYFEHGHVIGWHNSPMNPLRVGK